MKRRLNNTGTIYRLPGVRSKPFAVRVSTGEKVISKSGRVRYGTQIIGTYPTYDEAEYALAIYKRSPSQTKRGFFSVEDVWRAYRDTMSHRLSSGTMNNYMTLWKKLEPIADKDVSQLAVIECQSIIDSEPSPSVKAKIKMLLGNIIEFCPTLNITPRQVHQSLYAPTSRSKIKTVFSESEILRLWTLDSNRYCRAVLLMLYSGMRIGELYAADPAAAHMEERYIIGGEKTSAGKDRIIPIRREIMPLLEDHFRARRVTMSGFREGIRRFLADSGMDHTSHEARHTFISCAVQSAVPLPIIQRVVGHSTGSVTLSVYTHIQPAELVRAVDGIRFC